MKVIITPADDVSFSEFKETLSNWTSENRHLIKDVKVTQ
jgi:hypothetical protein